MPHPIIGPPIDPEEEDRFTDPVQKRAQSRAAAFFRTPIPASSLPAEPPPTSLFKPTFLSSLTAALGGFQRGASAGAEAAIGREEREEAKKTREAQLDIQRRGAKTQEDLAALTARRLEEEAAQARRDRQDKAREFSFGVFQKYPDLHRLAASAGINASSLLRGYYLGDLSPEQENALAGGLAMAFRDDTLPQFVKDTITLRIAHARLEKPKFTVEDEDKIREEVFAESLKSGLDPLSRAEMEVDNARAEREMLDAQIANLKGQSLRDFLTSTSESESHARAAMISLAATVFKTDPDQGIGSLQALLGASADDREDALSGLPASKPEDKRAIALLREAINEYEKLSISRNAATRKLAGAADVELPGGDPSMATRVLGEEPIDKRPPTDVGPFAPLPEPLRGGEFEPPAASPVGQFGKAFMGAGPGPLLAVFGKAAEWIGGDTPSQKIDHADSLVGAALENDRALRYLASKLDRFPDPTQNFKDDPRWADLSVDQRVVALKAFISGSSEDYFRDWAMLVSLGHDTWSQWKTGGEE